MICFSSVFCCGDTPEFRQWKQIDKVIHQFVHDSREWNERGYDGINNIVYDKFKINVSRDMQHCVVYSFDTEEDLVVFKLKYA